MIEECGSYWLVGFCEQLVDQTDRYRQLAAAVNYPRRNERREHKELMEAVLERDANRAVASECAHIRKTTDTVLKADLNFIPDELDPRLMGGHP